MSLPCEGLEGHLCPSLVKDWKDMYVPLLWRHLEHHEVGGATKMITLWSGGHELLMYGE